MTLLNHTNDSPSIGEMKPGSEAQLLALAKDKAEAGERAGNLFYKEAAEALVTTWKTHKTSQKKMAEALGRSQSWVSQLLRWHRAGCPAGSPFLRSNISRTNKPAASKSSAKSSASGRKPTSPANREFGAIEAFYKTELADKDDAAFDRVIKLLVDLRRKAKASKVPPEIAEALNKLDPETPLPIQEACSACTGHTITPRQIRNALESGDLVSDKEPPTVGIVAGNGVDVEATTEERKAANADDFNEIPPLLRRTPSSDIRRAAA